MGGDVAGVPSQVFSGAGPGGLIFSLFGRKKVSNAPAAAVEAGNGEAHRVVDVLLGGSGGAPSAASNRSFMNQYGSFAKTMAVDAAAVALGATGITSGIQQGGGRGALTAIASGLGTAAALSPDPLTKSVLAVAALGASLIGGFLGDPKQQREQEIQRSIRDARYQESAGVDYFMDTNGMTLDYDKRGGLRNVQNVTIQVNALDAKSILDRAGEITDAVRYATRRGHDFNDTIREVAQYG